MREFLDPVSLTYKSSADENAQSFKFSLQTLDDALISKQKSGHYSFTTDVKTAETDSFMAIREIHVTQGDFIAQIDVVFSQESELNRHKKDCDEKYSTECNQENETYLHA